MKSVLAVSSNGFFTVISIFVERQRTVKILLTSTGFASPFYSKRDYKLPTVRFEAVRFITAYDIRINF